MLNRDIFRGLQLKYFFIGTKYKTLHGLKTYLTIDLITISL